MERLIDPKNQKIFYRDYLCVFTPKSNERTILLHQEGWKIRDVNYCLGGSSLITKMYVLIIGNLIFYRPIKKIDKAEFENFFGYGPFATDDCRYFSTNIIKFSYGESLLVKINKIDD